MAGDMRAGRRGIKPVLQAFAQGVLYLSGYVEIMTRRRKEQQKIRKYFAKSFKESNIRQALDKERGVQ